MLFSLASQVVEIDVAIFAAGNWHDFHSSHHRARRICAMRACRNQADVAMTFAARLMVLCNDEQAGEFALASGIRLERSARKTSDLGEPPLELCAHFGIP